MGDPLALVLLALLVLQGLISLIGGIASARRRAPDPVTAQRLRQELSDWGIIETQARAKAPGAQDLLRRWADISARSRIGMGLGILSGAGSMLALLTLLTRAPLSAITPPFVLVVTLFLQGFSLGMFAGNALGLLTCLPVGTVGAPTAAGERASVKKIAWRLKTPKGGTVAARGVPPQSPRRRAKTKMRLFARRSSVPGAGHRLRPVALLPGALLVLDLLLVGGLDLLYLPHFTQAELWSLAVFPAVMLLICLLGAWFSHRLARLPPLRLTDDAALAPRADAGARARMIGMILETEVYSLFILVVCQWLVQAFSLAHPGGVIYNGSLLVYAVVIFSLRGLLERAQRPASGE